MASPAKVDYDKTVGFKLTPTTKTITANDMILYNLGIGFSQDPNREEDYQFTYE
jgi:hypothetical protein